MTRARQVANFDPALFAADEVSGDKVHGGTISGSPTLVTPNLGTPASGVLTNATFPAGHVLQTVSSTFTGTASGTGTTSTLPHADCSVSITPSHASNKILITVHSTLQTNGNAFANFSFFKDSTLITSAEGSDGNSNSLSATASTGYSSSTDDSTHRNAYLYPVSAQYLDTAGGTSAITYDFRVRARDSGGTWYLNRTADSNQNQDHVVNPISTITVQEIMRT